MRILNEVFSEQRSKNIFSTNHFHHRLYFFLQNWLHGFLTVSNTSEIFCFSLFLVYSIVFSVYGTVR